MYKMIIVDDEPSTRQGIAGLADWWGMGIDVCGQAENGIEALALLRETHPDVIICDVRMPKMDGITMVSQALTLLPRLRVIFISGYADKQYLQSAIRFGAVDYIDKPFEPFELVEAVERALRQLGDDAPAYEDNDLALRLLTHPHPESFSGDPAVMRLLAGCFVAHIRYVPTRSTEQLTGASLPMLMRTQYGILHQVLKRYLASDCLLSPLQDGFLLIAQGEPAERLPVLHALLAEVEFASTQLFLGVSNPHRHAASLKEAFQEAEEASRYAFFLGFGKIMCFAHAPTQPFVPDATMEGRIHGALQKGEIDTAIAWLRDYIAGMQGSNAASIPLIRNVLGGFSASILSQDGEKAALIHAIQTAQTLPDIQELLTLRMLSLTHAARALNPTAHIVAVASQYIDSSLLQIQSIQDVASHCHVSLSHLCYIFKKSTGVTLGEYMTQRKLARAEELLRTTDMKIGQISEMLGFQSADYFSKLFHRRFRQSPRDYRLLRK